MTEFFTSFRMRVLVINLDRCPDRMEVTATELARVGLSYERIQGIDGRDLDISNNKIAGYKTRPHNQSEIAYRGSAGCFLSHCKALEAAIESDVWPCLILEDDAAISRPIVMPETDKPIVYFGGWIDPGKKGFYGGHAICYRTRDAAIQVLTNAHRMPNTWDSCLVRLQRTTDMFHFELPFPIRQRAGFSIIQEKDIRSGRG